MVQGKEPRIFISYAHKDLGKVKQLYQQLKEAGFSPWLDTEDIRPGESWQDSLMRAIREAPFFLTCLSNNAFDEHGNIQEEMKEALKLWHQKSNEDMYFIPVRLEDCRMSEQLAKFQWIDIYQGNGFKTLYEVLQRGMQRLGIMQLRPKPLNNLSEEQVNEMLNRRNFFDELRNPTGTGIQHGYELKEINKNKVIIDHATGLMWQQSGSNEYMEFGEIKDYMGELNYLKFAGYGDWRLPTLEEAMSLMEAKRNETDGFFINPQFEKKQLFIWTGDCDSASRVWVVSFLDGICDQVGIKFGSYCVLAVRSDQ